MKWTVAPNTPRDLVAHIDGKLRYFIHHSHRKGPRNIDLTFLGELGTTPILLGIHTDLADAKADAESHNHERKLSHAKV